MKAALRGAGLAALFLALGLLLTRPLVAHFTTGIPYTRTADPDNPVKHGVFGDHLQLYFRFWLFGDVVDGHSAPYENRYEFSTSPGAAQPLWGYFQPYSLLFTALRPLGGAAGYNAGVLASFLLSGLSVFLLVRFYTGDAVAAAVGGAAFAASRYRVLSLLSGHPLGFSAFLLPLFLVCLERTLATRSRRAALGAGLVAAVLLDNDLQVLYLTALCAPLFVLAHFAVRPPREWATEARALALPLLLVALLAGGALAVKLPLLSQTGLAAAPARPFGEVTAYAPRLASALDRVNPVQATYVYPGAAAGLAALLGIVIAARQGNLRGEGRPALRRMLFYALLFAGAYALAFGPSLPFSAPYRFLYEHLPKFSQLRQTSKLMVLASCALAVLAGLGVAALRRRFPGRAGVLAAAAVLAGLVADGADWTGPGAGISVLPRSLAAYEPVFRDRPGSRVVNIPVWPGDSAWSSIYQYDASLYRTVMVNGYLPNVPAGYVEQVFRPLAPLNAGQLGERQYALLRGMGVEYVIVHQEAFPASAGLFPSQFALEGLRASPRLSLVAGEAPIWVFRVLAPGEVGDRAPLFPTSPVGVALPAWLTIAGETREDAAAASGRSLLVPPEVRSLALRSPRFTPAGRYLLTLNLAPEGTARLGLTARRAGGEVIATRSFEERGSGYRTATLEFSLPEAAAVEYHLDKPEGAGVALDWIYLRFADREDPPRAFEFDDLYHVGNVHPVAGASNQTALRLTPDDPVGQITRGPYRLLGPGDWVLALSLGFDAGPGSAPGLEEPVASVALRTHLDEFGEERDRPAGVILPEQVIRARQLAGPEPLVELAFPFTLARPTFLSVNVQSFRPGLILDRATLRRAGE